jgi:trans-2-enoyl-CoA reductase
MVNNLITVWLLWFIVVVSMWLIRMVLCKGSKDLEGDRSKAKVKLIKAIVTFASLLISILAIIISLIFILFIRENKSKATSKAEAIHQAALPKGFKELNKPIDKRVLDKKIEDVDNAAKEANDKAVKESIKFFESKK